MKTETIEINGNVFTVKEFKVGEVFDIVDLFQKNNDQMVVLHGIIDFLCEKVEMKKDSMKNLAFSDLAVLWEAIKKANPVFFSILDYLEIGTKKHKIIDQIKTKLLTICIEKLNSFALPDTTIKKSLNTNIPNSEDS